MHLLTKLLKQLNSSKKACLFLAIFLFFFSKKLAKISKNLVSFCANISVVFINQFTKKRV